MIDKVSILAHVILFQWWLNDFIYGPFEWLWLSLTWLQSFLVHEEMDIKSILTIASTRTLLAAPAFSFDRIIISDNYFHSIVISPVDRDVFLQKLLMINPEIAIKI